MLSDCSTTPEVVRRGDIKLQIKDTESEMDGLTYVPCQDNCFCHPVGSPKNIEVNLGLVKVHLGWKDCMKRVGILANLNERRVVAEEERREEFVRCSNEYSYK